MVMGRLKGLVCAIFTGHVGRLSISRIPANSWLETKPVILATAEHARSPSHVSKTLLRGSVGIRLYLAYGSVLNAVETS